MNGKGRRQDLAGKRSPRKVAPGNKPSATRQRELAKKRKKKRENAIHAVLAEKAATQTEAPAAE